MCMHACICMGVYSFVKCKLYILDAGHTHGGQFFPMMIGVYIVNPFFAGLYHYNEKNYVYVSQGTQYWGVPLRLGSTMEITEIILKASISSQKT